MSGRGWKTIDEALAMKRKPFPRPFQKVMECEGLASGVGNIGAPVQFGTRPSPYPEGVREFPRLTYIFNVHKDVTGPLLAYWFATWDKEKGYVVFDIRWIWKETEFPEPDGWMSAWEWEKGLRMAVEALQRVPEENRNRVWEKLVSGGYL